MGGGGCWVGLAIEIVTSYVRRRSGFAHKDRWPLPFSLSTLLRLPWFAILGAPHKALRSWFPLDLGGLDQFVRPPISTGFRAVVFDRRTLSGVTAGRGRCGLL